jgi:outer membrane protein assembly factor BamB
VQALDMKTGKVKWNFQATQGDTYNTACPFFLNCPEKAGPDFDFGMAPILTRDKNGKDILLIGQKSGVVFCLSPDNGKKIWETRIGKGGTLGGIHWGRSTDGKFVYAANSIKSLDWIRRIQPGKHHRVFMRWMSIQENSFGKQPIHPVLKKKIVFQATQRRWP